MSNDTGSSVTNAVKRATQKPRAVTPIDAAEVAISNLSNEMLRGIRITTDDATMFATALSTRTATMTDAYYPPSYKGDSSRFATEHTIATELQLEDMDELLPGWATELAYELAGGNPSLVELMLKCVSRWSNVLQGGNMWGAWDAYLTAARDILGLKLEAHAKYASWEQAAIHGSYRWMHPQFCMVSDFPELIKTDDQNRAHCDDGPSHRWRDGWSLWHIHGVRVTKQIVLRPETQTVAEIRAEENAEVKRIRIERFTWSRYLMEINAVVLDERYNAIEAVKEALMQTPDNETVLICACPSTARVYAQEVPPTTTTCVEAQLWLSGGLSSRIIAAT